MAIDVVLVATDFSQQAELAVAQAVNIATSLGAELVLLHVDPVAEPAPRGVVLSARALTQMQSVADEVRQQAEQRLENLATRLRREGLEVSTRFTVGRPDESIVNTAGELGVGLIVTATHGRSGVARFLLGSVAERVVRQSDIPVLVVRSRVADVLGFKRVLVPTDFSPASEASLALATALAHDEADIDLYHVWQLPGVQRGESTEIESLDLVTSEIQAAVAVTAQRWIERHRRGRQTLRFEQDSGPAAQKIQERLEGGDVPFDLVALGAHGQRGFRRLILGRIAERTVRHAPCSALVTRVPDID